MYLVGTDEVFIEQRRRGLYRFINFVGNHPVLKNDETVIDFLKVQLVLQSNNIKVSPKIIFNYVGNPNIQENQPAIN